ncbi:MAG: M1 family aminopeptidase [candidate division KSB1 bacterium]|jgi:aminopeptidase N|nr:M1 family aminopeptidase [candidate division KSB1 bacterium]
MVRNLHNKIIFGVLLILLCAASAADGQIHRSSVRKLESYRHVSGSDNALTRFLNDQERPYDVIWYGLSLRVFPDIQQIAGSVSMTAISGKDGFQEVRLDLYDKMIVDSVTSDLGKITHIHDDDELIVYLSDAIEQDSGFSFTIHYHGQPVQAGGFAPFRFDFHDGFPIISTLSEPFGAPAWWPCKDDPADKADSVDIAVTVPQEYVVASNGTLESIADNGDGSSTYRWVERYPISTYLVSVAMTNYVEFSDYYRYSDTDSMEVRYYVYPEHFEAAKQDFSVTVDMISFFSSIYGQYPFLNEKYGMAEFPWGGAMEHQTCTSYGANLITGDNRFDYINAHELAHQWFGDLVTIRDWSHIWLNEGFATYSEALWFEHTGGNQALEDYMKALDRGYFPTSVYVTDSTSINSLFSYTVYDKGAWVLHMLRYVMGESSFFDALVRYAKTFAYGNANTRDFQNICESFYGKSLDWFFDQWVYGSFRPLYTYSWDYIDESMKSIELTIEQTQTNTGLFKMPLDIRLRTDGGELDIVLWDSLEIQTFLLEADDMINDLVIDHHGRVLKFLRLKNLYKPMTLYQNYPNPFAENTTIQFALPVKGDVSLTIYNVLGQRVVRLIDGIRFNRLHEINWDGRDAHGGRVSSGVYLYELKLDDQYVERKKMTLIRHRVDK